MVVRGNHRSQTRLPQQRLQRVEDIRCRRKVEIAGQLIGQSTSGALATAHAIATQCNVKSAPFKMVSLRGPCT